MTSEDLALDAAATLALCLAVGVLAVVLSDVVARWIALPAVVLEILGGIIVGPAVLGLAEDNEIVAAFSELGLTVLIFIAGYEIQVSRLAGRPLRSAGAAWVTSLLLGLAVGVLVVSLIPSEDDVSSGVLVGLLFTTTALGTLLPILRDSGELDTPFGTVVLAGGAVGEFGPILAIALLLSSESLGHTLVVLLVFGLTAGVVLVLAMRPRSTRVVRLLSHTLETSGQLGVRIAMLLVLLLAWVAASLGLDILLGAFVAGLVARVFLSGSDDVAHRGTVERLEGVGFGFLIPIFFVVSGIRFDLDALLAEPSALLLVPLSLLLFLGIRGVPAYVALRESLPGRDRVGASIYTSAALPLVVVITTLGVSEGRLSAATAAAFVGAGMLSVLLFPLAADRIRGTSRTERAATGGPGDAL